MDRLRIAVVIIILQVLERRPICFAPARGGVERIHLASPAMLALHSSR